ncbi:hypothetical protein RR48_10425 [Papilio machaon]|uniref:Uncharacterized protein n=1 Tax=Papilio machaon TaxID=76193 RepID=A0A194R6C8_PAPMA|nr:hypothetical protein RR48_10425 [Papilio machaon]
MNPYIKTFFCDFPTIVFFELGAGIESRNELETKQGGIKVVQLAVLQKPTNNEHDDSDVGAASAAGAGGVADESESVPAAPPSCVGGTEGFSGWSDTSPDSHWVESFIRALRGAGYEKDPKVCGVRRDRVWPELQAEGGGAGDTTTMRAAVMYARRGGPALSWEGDIVALPHQDSAICRIALREPSLI